MENRARFKNYNMRFKLYKCFKTFKIIPPPPFFFFFFFKGTYVSALPPTKKYLLLCEAKRIEQQIIFFLLLQVFLQVQGIKNCSWNKLFSQTSLLSLSLPYSISHYSPNNLPFLYPPVCPPIHPCIPSSSSIFCSTCLDAHLGLCSHETSRL